MASKLRNHKRTEPRWPIVLAMVAVFVLLGALPARIRVVPAWIPPLVGAVGVLPMIGVSLASDKALWLRFERTITLLFFGLMATGTLTSLAYLVEFMIRRSTEVRGLTLLTSSVGVWVNNVLMFSLLYWQVDRGGPGVRPLGDRQRPDWLFPQEGAPAKDLPSSWRPTYVDYLFLAFSTATAFSSTDVLPLTPRAKVMMMVESSISLVTLVVVAARAINVLGN
jgi:hypothetical protein